MYVICFVFPPGFQFLHHSSSLTNRKFCGSVYSLRCNSVFVILCREESIQPTWREVNDTFTHAFVIHGLCSLNLNSLFCSSDWNSIEWMEIGSVESIHNISTGRYEMKWNGYCMVWFEIEWMCTMSLRHDMTLYYYYIVLLDGGLKWNPSKGHLT